MEIIVVAGVNGDSPIRFNLDHLVFYNDQVLFIQGQVIEISPGTSKALDKLLKERVGCALHIVEAIKED